MSKSGFHSSLALWTREDQTSKKSYRKYSNDTTFLVIGGFRWSSSVCTNILCQSLRLVGYICNLLVLATPFFVLYLHSHVLPHQHWGLEEHHHCTWMVKFIKIWHSFSTWPQRNDNFLKLWIYFYFILFHIKGYIYRNNMRSKFLILLR